MLRAYPLLLTTVNYVKNPYKKDDKVLTVICELIMAKVTHSISNSKPNQLLFLDSLLPKKGP